MGGSDGVAFAVFLAVVLGGLVLFSGLLLGVIVSLWRREKRHRSSRGQFPLDARNPPHD